MRGILGFYIVLKPKINLKHTFNVNFCLKTTVIPFTKTNRKRSDRRIENRLNTIKKIEIRITKDKNQNLGHTTNKKNRDSATDEYIIQRRMVAYLATN